MKVFKVNDKIYINLDTIKEFSKGRKTLFIYTKDGLTYEKDLDKDKQLLVSIRENTFEI